MVCRMRQGFCCFFHNQTRAIFKITGTDSGEEADYCSEEEMITFMPGEQGTELCISIAMVDDDLCEDSETFSVGLTSIDGGVMTINSPVLVTITDDDGMWIT